MIDLTIDRTGLARAVARARERNIIIPTLAQQKDPALIPEAIREELHHIGLWDVHPRNLFRITWKNEPVAHGGDFD
ncbi:MAG TPA: pyridoxal-5-phosphate-dependent protein subunit beta, partial [Chloroflexi bacterium]|nr:pyridoxal-5-phosphate-dependent protein subunit beta [Chloroflexota bacterium]